MKMKTAKKISRIVLLTMVSIGLVGFSGALFGGVMNWLNIRLVSTSFQTPNFFTSPSNLLVDKQGNIYSYNRYFGRLQIYDNSGQFIIGWFVPQPSILALSQNDTRIIALEDDDSQTVYDLRGNVIGKTVLEKGAFRERVKLHGTTTHKDAEGNSYEFVGTFISPYVMQTTSDGQKHKVVLNEPLYLWPFRWFSPGCFFLLVPMIAVLISKAVKRKRGNPTEAVTA